MPSGLIGYTGALSVRLGESISLKLSSRTEKTCRLALHRVTGARWTDAGVIPKLAAASHPATEETHSCTHQPIPAGSWGLAPAPPDIGQKRYSFGLWVRITGRAVKQASLMSLCSSSGDVTLGLNQSGHICVTQGENERTVLKETLPANTWVMAVCEVNGCDIRLFASRDGQALDQVQGQIDPFSDAQTVMFAAGGDDTSGLSGFFSGRLSQPAIFACPGETLLHKMAAGVAQSFATAATCLAAWNFSDGISTQVIRDIGPSRCDGVLRNRPIRAVTGPFWSGSAVDWCQAPDHYSAIHFHADDLDDCVWKDTITLTVPAEWSPGLYIAEVSNGDGQDRIPFVVRSAAGSQLPKLAVLLPTFTYLSYGNARDAMRGPDFGVATYPDEETLAEHPALGRSQYDLHDDRSPVMFSSPRRPLMSMRFGIRPWGLPVDGALLGFLEHLGVSYDILTDDDLHSEGYRALSGYDCVLTGNHPEYCSAQMLDALDAFTHRGGRLCYLGGNGFYWRVSVCPEVGTIEVRRAEDGTRAWIAAPGESYHAMDGGYGGLWRRLGRAPNTLVDVGFAAQGDFDHSGYYLVAPSAREGQGAFALQGVTGESFGDYGWLGGGAAGQEIDRADPALGTSPDTEVLASSTGHAPAMMRTIEEMLSTVPPFEDPKARADVTFRSIPGGGAVFSVGSMTWIASLDHNGFENEVARITQNVIRRFLHPAPFEDRINDE